MSADVPKDQRISDDGLLDLISTFLFAGFDTTALTLTWTFHLLALNPDIQTRLREELLTVPVHYLPSDSSFVKEGDLTGNDESLAELEEYCAAVEALPYLDAVLKESCRLNPAVHSTLRVATHDDQIPVDEPVKMRDGTIVHSIGIKKGQYVHIPFEGMNVDREIWGEDGWEFRPERWSNLPAAVTKQPGAYQNLMTFSSGIRACIGMGFAIKEIKLFMHMLLSNFVLQPTDAKIFKTNVVLSRPYVSGKVAKGSSCPIKIVRYRG